MNNQQKITGNIQAPNKDLEMLKSYFLNCFDKNGAFDFEKFKKQFSKNEINFSKESYVMDWLGKSYARLLATDETTTLLKEDEIFNQKTENASSQNLKVLLEKIDSDTTFNPTTIIAFGYHFESKNLREISENIKSYTNKKYGY